MTGGFRNHPQSILPSKWYYRWYTMASWNPHHTVDGCKLPAPIILYYILPYILRIEFCLWNDDISRSHPKQKRRRAPQRPAPKARTRRPLCPPRPRPARRSPSSDARAAAPRRVASEVAGKIPSKNLICHISIYIYICVCVCSYLFIYVSSIKYELQWLWKPLETMFFDILSGCFIEFSPVESHSDSVTWPEP